MPHCGPDPHYPAKLLWFRRCRGGYRVCGVMVNLRGDRSAYGSPELMRVSVIIPTYQRADLTLEALGSALCQSLSPAEVIVVDDGSTDGTLKRVREFGASLDSSVSVVCLSQEHKGGNAARNKGIAAANHDLIAFLDSDDLWEPSKLMAQVRLLLEHPSAVGCFCDAVEFVGPRDDSVPASDVVGTSVDLAGEILVRDSTAPTSCWVAKRSALLEAGCFDVALEARQDWDMWIRLAQLGDIVHCQSALTWLRVHDGERTASDPTREKRAYAVIRKKYAAQIKRLPWHMRRRARAAYHLRMARVTIHYEDQLFRGAIRALLAFVLWPLEPHALLLIAGRVLPPRLRESARGLWSITLGRGSWALRSH